MANEKEKELNRILEQLNAKNRETVSLEKDKNRQLEIARDLYDAQLASANDIYNTITGVVSELTKERTTRTQINRASRDLLGISTKLLNNQEGIESFTEKQLNREIEKVKINTSILKRLKDQGEYATKQAGNIQSIINLEDRFLNQLTSARNESKAVADALGLTGGLLKAIVSTPGLSQFASLFKIEDAVESMEEFSRKQIEALKSTPEFAKQYAEQQRIISRTSDLIADATADLESQKAAGLDTSYTEKKILNLKNEQAKAQEKVGKLNEETAKAATGFIGKTRIALHGLGKTITNLQDSLTDPAALFTLLVTSATSVNSQVVALSKSLALSYDEAQELRKEFSSVANSSEDSFISTKKLLEAQSQLNEILGLQGKVVAENAKAFVDITQRLGASAESAAKLQLFAEATGASFEQQKLDSYEIAQSVSSQFGVQLNIKQVMEEVGKAGAYALAQNKGSVKALTEAVSMAKALGLELSEVNSIAGELLNFESSIAAELEAELLTGRAINLERARFAALVNDQKTLMEEINREMGDFSDFQAMNAIQQQAFARSLGLNVNQLSDMLLLEQYRDKNQAQITAEAGKEVAKRVEMLNTQERFNAAIEKLQDIVVNLVEGPLGNMAQLVSNILSNSVALGAIMGAAAAGPLIKMVKGLHSMYRVTKLILAAERATTVARIAGAAAINPAAIGFAIAGAVAGAAILSAATKGDDVISPGYGKRVIMSPEGTIALNNKDTIVAGTDLNQGTPSSENTMMASEMRRTNQLLAQILNKEGQVAIDSSKAGRAFTMGTYRMQ